MPKITPFLWFDNQAEEAARFYVSVFPNSKVVKISKFEGAPGPRDTGKVVTFSLDGQEVIALDGGPLFKFSEAVSLSVDCKTQEEVDRYWGKLTADGGAEGPCGWLKDKYGFSWQIVPTILNELLCDADRKKAGRAMEAMLKMKKLDIETLKRAYEGTPGRSPWPRRRTFSTPTAARRSPPRS